MGVAEAVALFRSPRRQPSAIKILAGEISPGKDAPRRCRRTFERRVGARHGTRPLSNSSKHFENISILSRVDHGWASRSLSEGHLSSILRGWVEQRYPLCPSRSRTEGRVAKQKSVACFRRWPVVNQPHNGGERVHLPHLCLEEKRGSR